MNLDRNPFVASACEDMIEHRTCLVAVSDLLGSHLPDEPGIDLDMYEEHAVTETFLSLWRNLSDVATTSRATLLSVMHGITIEHRHPAYRVSETCLLHVYQAQVGSDITLVFRSDQAASQAAGRAATTWLAVLHGH